MKTQHPLNEPRLEDEAASRPETLPEAEPKPDGKTAAAPTPGACQRYMRQRFADALPTIADFLLAAAKGGDLPCLKMVLQIAQLEDEPEVDLTPHRCKSLEEMLMDDWRKEPTE